MGTRIRLSIRRPRGLSLTEIVVIAFIAVAITVIMASTLGVFSQTTAVDLAAERMATALREARYTSMAQGTEVIPLVLRDTSGNYTVVFAARALHMQGTLRRSDLKLPLVDRPAGQDESAEASARRWSVSRYVWPDVDLTKGAFVYLASSQPLDLNRPEAEQAWGELVFLRADPPAAGEGIQDEQPGKVEILMRGVHNTALGHFTPETTGGEGVDGYVVVSGTREPLEMGTPDLDRRHLLDGFEMPAGVWIDQLPRADREEDLPNRVQATLTARAGVAFERTWRATGQAAYEDASTHPVWRPVFDPGGYVRPYERIGQNHDMQIALRIVDGATGDQRYVVVRASDGLITTHDRAFGNLDAWGHPAEVNFRSATVQGRVDGKDTSRKRLALPAEKPLSDDAPGKLEEPMPGVRADTQVQGRVDGKPTQPKVDTDE